MTEQAVNKMIEIGGGRFQWLDIYKGIAIILVVVGHLEISDGLYKYIYMFHMYAFFFAAGITFKIKRNDTFTAILLKNIKGLYIPYLFFAFMWDITNMIIQVTHGNHYDFTLSALVKNIFAVEIGRGIVYSNASIGPAWFLLCLFVVRITFWLILRGTRSILLQFAICVILFLLGYELRGHEFMPFFVIQSLTTYIFVFFGYALKEYWLTMVNALNTISLLIVGILSVSLTLILSHLSNCKLILLNNILPDNILIILGAAVSGIITIYSLSAILSKVKHVNTILIWCGINSLIIMGTHVEIRTGINMVLGNMLICNQLMAAIKTILILMISFPIAYLLKAYCPLLVSAKHNTKEYNCDKIKTRL